MSEAKEKKTAPRTQPGDAYRMEVAAKVLADMETGMSLTKSLEKNKLNTRTWNDWVCEDKQLAQRYAQARIVMIDAQAEALVRLSEEPVPLTPDGKYDNGAVQARRLEIDTKKWLISKLAPQRYGERVAFANDTENPLIAPSAADAIIAAALKGKA